MCTREFLAQEFLCAVFLVGELGGEGGGWRKMGSKVSYRM